MKFSPYKIISGLEPFYGEYIINHRFEKSKRENTFFSFLVILVNFIANKVYIKLLHFVRYYNIMN